MPEPTRKSIDLPSGALSLLEWERPGAPVLVFSHANGFNAETYLTLLSPLAGELHMVALDQRGHGFSTLPASPGMADGWRIFCEDLLALLHQLSDEPVILAGHSLGATVSLMSAAQAAGRIRALALLEPVLPPPLAFQSAQSLVERTLQRRDVFPSFDAALASYRGRGIFASWPEEVIADYLRGGLVATDDGAVQLACKPRWEAEIFADTRSGLAPLTQHVTCPTLIVHGTVSSTAAPSEIATICSLKPDTRAVSIEGAGHFLPMEQPDRVRAEIRRLLTSM